MRSSTGWIKLHREIMKKPIWIESTPEQKTILITLMMMVNSKPSKVVFNGNLITLNAGECVTSIRELEKLCGLGVTQRNIRSALVKFEKYEFLTQKVTHRGTLIKIENWGTYQGQHKRSDTTSDTEVTQKRHSSDTLGDTILRNKEYKNIKNIRNTLSDIVAGECEILHNPLFDYIEMREKIKAPLTEKGLKVILSKLKRLSEDVSEQVRILDQSTVKCWKDVFEVKESLYDNVNKKSETVIEDPYSVNF